MPDKPKFNQAKELAASTFEGAALLNYLTLADKLPSFAYSNSLGPEINGEYKPSENAIYIASGNPVPEQRRTAVHELTHAADDAMYRQTKQASQQFADAYAKLIYKYGRGVAPSEFNATALAKRIAPAWQQENSSYRASNLEIPAFGVGNHSSPLPVANPAPSHIDATAATEFMILLDLAVRDLQAKQKVQQK